MRPAIVLIGVASSLALVTAASAQAARPHFIIVRGTIASFQGSTLMVKTSGGSTTDVELGAKTNVGALKKIALSDIKPGSYIGTAAVPGQDTSLRALEVMVFPPSMRGVGEGHSPYDLGGPKSSMTNGTVGKVTATPAGRQITVSYKTGSQTVTVAPTTPVVTPTAAGRGDLKPGAVVFVLGAPGTAGGKVDARLITVEKNGVVPPM